MRSTAFFAWLARSEAIFCATSAFSTRLKSFTRPLHVSPSGGSSGSACRDCFERCWRESIDRETHRSKARTGGSAPARETSVESRRRSFLVALYRCNSTAGLGSVAAEVIVLGAAGMVLVISAGSAAAKLEPLAMQEMQRRSWSAF